MTSTGAPTGRRTAILGATSAIAQAWARLRAAAGDELFLVARDGRLLAEIAQDLRVRGAGRVETWERDLDDLAGHDALAEAILGSAGHLDVALLAHGILGDQARAETDFAHARQIITTDFISPASLLGILASRFEARGEGVLVAISSVAGDRGRASNYAYGSAKAGLTAWCSGLRQRLWRKGVHVITIEPGFVDTPMTKAFPKGPLWASPDVVARGIERAVERRKPVAYVPWFWRPIMAVIRHLPERLFVRIRI